MEFGVAGFDIFWAGGFGAFSGWQGLVGGF